MTNQRADNLLNAYSILDWNVYVQLCDELIKIDREDLEAELTKQAYRYSHYNGLLALAKRDRDNAVKDVETFFAKTRTETAAEILERTKKKATDKALDALVIGSDEYKELNTKAEAAKEKFNLLQALVRSLEMRKDMLVQLSSNARSEAKLYN